MIELLESRLLRAVDLTITADIKRTPVRSLEDDGGSYWVDYTVKNIGSTTFSGEVAFNDYISKDTTIDGFDPFNPHPDATAGEFLDPGETFTNSRIGDAPPQLEAGDYYLILQLDPDNAVAEGNEGNNVFVSATPVIRVVTQSIDGSNIHGTAGDDRIYIVDTSWDTFVTMNGVDYVIGPDFGQAADQIFIDGAQGNDKIIADDASSYAGAMTTNLLITGSGGNDTIVGGWGSDSISGANGKDRIFGGDGKDHLLGAAGNDYLDGGLDDDVVSGAGGNDRLFGLSGADYCLGGAGNDVFVTNDGVANDSLSGGIGTDYALCDAADGRASIEQLLA
jgi:Ca2+-binding RTX toxin-like protein